MAQNSYAFAVARIRALETHLLDSGRLQRIKDAPLAEAVRLLQETGYGQGARVQDGDIEPLIRAELSAARKTVWELTPAPEVTGLFLLHTDAHNLKALLKARLLERDCTDILLEGGLFEVEKLKTAVENKDYRELPEAFAKALGAAEKTLSAAPDPCTLSAAVDRALFEYAAGVLARSKQEKMSFAVQYFAADADFTNASSVLRARALSWNASKLRPMLVGGGTFSEKYLVEALDAPEEQLSKKLCHGTWGHRIAKAADAVQAGDAGALENARDAVLMATVKAGKSDPFGLAPVVGYLLGREAEAKALRLIFAGKRAGKDVALPSLYV